MVCTYGTRLCADARYHVSYQYCHSQMHVALLLRLGLPRAAPLLPGTGRLRWTSSAPRCSLRTSGERATCLSLHGPAALTPDAPAGPLQLQQLPQTALQPERAPKQAADAGMRASGTLSARAMLRSSPHQGCHTFPHSPPHLKPRFQTTPSGGGTSAISNPRGRAQQISADLERVHGRVLIRLVRMQISDRPASVLDGKCSGEKFARSRGGTGRRRLLRLTSARVLNDWDRAALGQPADRSSPRPADTTTFQ